MYTFCEPKTEIESHKPQPIETFCNRNRVSQPKLTSRKRKSINTVFEVLFIMLIIFVTVGTTWFILDEGNSVIDALYMVIIIITTVGYGMDEFMEDDRNQIFLIFYIVFGVALITTFLNIMFVGMLDGLSKKQLRFFDAEDSDCFTATTVSEVY